MLSRRHLRVKVLQTLYSYHQSKTKDFRFFERALLNSVDAVYELYIWFLSLLVEVADYSAIDADVRANKYIPSSEDLSADNRLQKNRFVVSLQKNSAYAAALKKYKISWSFDPEVCKSIFIKLKETTEYGAYLAFSTHSLQSDRDMMKYIAKKIILKSEGVLQVFEEKFINWPVDEEVLQILLAKTFKNFSDETVSGVELASISPNWDEDRAFLINLFLNTINFEAAYQKLIAEKTTNWETDRIALMDILLMRMAITEVLHCPSIPVKVTINEYIEISKQFSTPNSNSFINGILDKILSDLQRDGRIRKTGRGLI